MPDLSPDRGGINHEIASRSTSNSSEILVIRDELIVVGTGAYAENAHNALVDLEKGEVGFATSIESLEEVFWGTSEKNQRNCFPAGVLLFEMILRSGGSQMGTPIEKVRHLCDDPRLTRVALRIPLIIHHGDEPLGTNIRHLMGSRLVPQVINVAS